MNVIQLLVVLIRPSPNPYNITSKIWWKQANFRDWKFEFCFAWTASLEKIWTYNIFFLIGQLWKMYVVFYGIFEESWICCQIRRCSFTLRFWGLAEGKLIKSCGLVCCLQSYGMYGLKVTPDFLSTKVSLCYLVGCSFSLPPFGYPLLGLSC